LVSVWSAEEQLYYDNDEKSYSVIEKKQHDVGTDAKFGENPCEIKNPEVLKENSVQRSNLIEKVGNATEKVTVCKRDVGGLIKYSELRKERQASENPKKIISVNCFFSVKVFN
jgi:hypothetical protein